MAVTLADLPGEFAAVDPTVADYWIRKATAAIDSRRWVCAGVDPDEGIEALAAHKLKMAGQGDDIDTSAGVVTSEAVGGVSVSASMGSEASGKHGGTPYGQAFDDLLERVLSKRRRFIARPAP